MILSDADSWINADLLDLVADWADATRARFRHTLVVHASDLPQGKGWSPLTWQSLAGRDRIHVTLFEAAQHVDSGVIYAQRWLEFQGHELIDELRAALTAATLELCRWFVDCYPESLAQAREQTGEETFYSRRRPADSRLDPDKTIAEQFDLLRVVDNERYPALIEWQGRHYKLRIEQTELLSIPGQGTRDQPEVKING